ncbi:hypothetical protein P4571_10675 [Niallia alba]|nr:hypothetical protein [Niallia alba]
MLKKIIEIFFKKGKEKTTIDNGFEEYEFLNGDTIEYRKEDEADYQ